MSGSLRRSRPALSDFVRAWLHSLRKKEHFVIPNPRCLRVRDLLFARTPQKKQIPHPVQKPNGIRNDIFFQFFHSLLDFIRALLTGSRRAVMRRLASLGGTCPRSLVPELFLAPHGGTNLLQVIIVARRSRTRLTGHPRAHPISRLVQRGERSATQIVINERSRERVARTHSVGHHHTTARMLASLTPTDQQPPLGPARHADELQTIGVPEPTRRSFVILKLVPQKFCDDGQLVLIQLQDIRERHGL